MRDISFFKPLLSNCRILSLVNPFSRAIASRVSVIPDSKPLRLVIISRNLGLTEPLAGGFSIMSNSSVKSGNYAPTVRSPQDITILEIAGGKRCLF